MTWFKFRLASFQKISGLAFITFAHSLQILVQIQKHIKLCPSSPHPKHRPVKKRTSKIHLWKRKMRGQDILSERLGTTAKKKNIVAHFQLLSRPSPERTSSWAGALPHLGNAFRCDRPRRGEGTKIAGCMCTTFTTKPFQETKTCTEQKVTRMLIAKMLLLSSDRYFVKFRKFPTNFHRNRYKKI